MSAPMEYAKLTGPQKAAILVAVLDDDAASTICQHLPEEDLQRVAREISRLGRIPSHISQQVLREYRQMTAGRDYVSEGGRETTHRLLTRVLGEDGATSMLHKLLRVDELDANRAPALSRPPIPSNSPGCSGMPGFFVPVEMRQTGTRGEGDGTRKEAHGGADCESAAAG